MDNSKKEAKTEPLVLLVDDEKDYTLAMSYWLKSKGYAVVSTFDGEGALKMIKENPPDIVLLDLNMPVMDGVETLKRIREFNKDLPVIIISAFVQDLRLKEAPAYNISGVFYKGEDFSASLALLEAALRTHKKLKK